VGVCRVLHRPTILTTRIKWWSSRGHHLPTSWSWSSLATVGVRLWLLYQVILHAGHGARWQLVSVVHLLVALHVHHSRVHLVLLWVGGPSHVLGRRRATSLWLVCWKPWTRLGLARVLEPSLWRALLIGGVGVRHSGSLGNTQRVQKVASGG